MKILLIEDEIKVSSFIKKGLIKEEFEVDAELDGKEGLKKAFRDYDLIILDLMLPQIDGFSILTKLRAEGIKTPIIILTAKGNIEDRIEGLNAGADDYVVKPFAFGELLARIKALLRRNNKNKNPFLVFGDFRINTESREVFRQNKKIELSLREYSLLEFLVYNTNRALSRSEIGEHVWNYDFNTGTNFIDVYINRLRKKIDDNYENKFIVTIRGFGYMFKYSESKKNNDK